MVLQRRIDFAGETRIMPAMTDHQNHFGPTSHRIISQRLKLHYVDWGNPTAPPLILLHGGRDHCRSWDWTARALREKFHVIAPDLRGHGDSDWSAEGAYPMEAFVYDLAQLIHQLDLAPVTIVAHSLGGNISLRYTGLYPDNVKKLVAIEGLGLSPELIKKMEAVGAAQRLRDWIDAKRAASGRTPKRYATLAEATERMKAANDFLSDKQAAHLTLHGATRNEDGTWSWKFDPYVRIWPPTDIPREAQHALWAAITCPTVLVYGNDSWASNPVKDGRIAYFTNGAEVKTFDKAGHWVHHDRFDSFIDLLNDFL